MLHAFFDDSGKFSNSDFVCLAGYIATDENWDGLCNEWGPLLMRHKIPFVHMRDMIALQGPYASLGWDALQRDAVLQEFINVIRKYVVGGFAVGVDSKHLRSMSKEAKTLIGDPTMLCFQRLLRMIVNKLESVGYESSIAAVFDDCEEYSVRCYRMWAALRSTAPELSKKIPSITFADDVVFWPLQAADILAWETNKHLRQEAGGHKTRKQLESLMQSPDPNYGLDYESERFDAQELESLYTRIKNGEVKFLKVDR